MRGAAKIKNFWLESSFTVIPNKGVSAKQCNEIYILLPLNESS